MIIELKGSYEEIKNEILKLFPDLGGVILPSLPVTSDDEKEKIIDELMDVYHWSETKGQSLDMEEMDTMYLINCLKQLDKNKRAKDLFVDPEFKALILHIGYRIVEKAVEELEEIKKF